MMRALRTASLFMVYAGLGWAGDRTAAMLADEPARDEGSLARVDVRIERDSGVEVDVQVRTSDECAAEVERRVTIDLRGTLEIAVGAGSLRVEGREGADQVVAVGRACASSRELLEELDLTADVSAGDVRLSAHYPDGPRWRGGDARIDLVVTLPMGSPVRIADSSGEIVTSGTGELRIVDSSGGIEVRGALGSVQIDDSSGGIELEGVSGDVEISDGSGGIDVRGVEGSVAVRDGSGGIEIVQIGGDVRVEADGSGGIDVAQVAGDFTVGGDGSGGIRHSAVAGRVDVPQRRR